MLSSLFPKASMNDPSYGWSDDEDDCLLGRDCRDLSRQVKHQTPKTKEETQQIVVETRWTEVAIHEMAIAIEKMPIAVIKLIMEYGTVRKLLAKRKRGYIRRPLMNASNRSIQYTKHNIEVCLELQKHCMRRRLDDEMDIDDQNGRGRGICKRRRIEQPNDTLDTSKIIEQRNRKSIALLRLLSQIYESPDHRHSIALTITKDVTLQDLLVVIRNPYVDIHPISLDFFFDAEVCLESVPGVISEWSKDLGRLALHFNNTECATREWLLSALACIEACKVKCKKLTRVELECKGLWKIDDDVMQTSRAKRRRKRQEFQILSMQSNHLIWSKK